MAETTPLQLTIRDMDCSACVTSITAAIRRLDHAATVSADLRSKQVVIASIAGAAEIAAAVEAAGFTVA